MEKLPGPMNVPHNQGNYRAVGVTGRTSWYGFTTNARTQLLKEGSHGYNVIPGRIAFTGSSRHKFTVMPLCVRSRFA